MRIIKKNRPRNRRAAEVTQRQRTMTYYRSGSNNREEVRQKKAAQPGRMNNFIVRVRGVLIALALLGGAIYGLILKPVPEVLVNDRSYRDPAEYQRSAARQLDGLANRNKITVDANQLTEHLQDEFPEIKTVKLNLPLIGQTPRLEIAVAPPSLAVQVGGTPYVVDAQGRLIGPAKGFTAIKDLTQINDESGYEAKVGRQLLGSEAVAFIKILDRQLKTARIDIESITLPALPNELHLRPTGSSYFVKFNLSGDPVVQIGQFLAAKKHFSSSGQQPAEYVDARIAGKIFYK